MTDTTINKSIFINASREIVWLFLTNKDKLGTWFYPALADLEEGKDYTLVDGVGESKSEMCWGQVLEANQPAYLKYSFTFKPLNGVITTVMWTLEEAAGGTKVSLAHEGIDGVGRDAALGLLMALDEGWDKHIAKLRSNVVA